MSLLDIGRWQHGTKGNFWKILKNKKNNTKLKQILNEVARTKYIILHTITWSLILHNKNFSMFMRGLPLNLGKLRVE